MTANSEIKVVNCRKQELQKLGYNSLLEFLNADQSKHMYVGRNMTHYVKGAVQSKWHNPFKVQNNDAQAAVQRFKEYVKKGPLYHDLHELKGKTLACWCYPAPCHATALKEIYEEKFPGEDVKRKSLFDFGNDFPPLRRG